MRTCVFGLVVGVLGGCVPGPGLMFDSPVTLGASSGLGESGEEDGEDGEGGTPTGGSTLPPGPPGTGAPPDPTMGSGASEDSAETGETGGGGATALLVPAQSAWRFHTGAAPAGDWRALEFDDAGWSTGQAPLGTATEGTAPLPADGDLVRLRHRFTWDGDPATAAGLMVYLRRDDGGVVHLNGQELARSNMPLGDLSEASGPDGAVSGEEALRYFRAVAPADALQTGENVVAVALHRRAGQQARAFDLQLELLDLAAEPTDRVSVQVRTSGYGGEYADKHVLAMWVERDGAFVKSVAVYAEERREHLLAWNQASGGSTVDAVSGATRKGHATRVLAWDLRDGAGQMAPAGDYTLRVEFSEEDSNDGAPAGPTVAVPFTLGGGPKVAPTMSAQRFRDWLVISP